MKLPTTNSTLGGVALLALCAAGGVAKAQGAPKQFYRLESAQVIASPTDPDWDYLTFDPTRSYLYIARRDDGILMYDTRARKVVGVIEDSAGGNATTLVPEFDRGYVTKEDGTATVFSISTLQVIGHAKFGESADNAFYDPVTKQLLVTMGGDKKAAFADAKTGEVVGTLPIDSSKLEGAVADGKGNFYLALRDRNKILRIDARQRRVTAEWTPAKCIQPNSVAYDTIHSRLFVTCRGDHPILAVIDPESGRVVASPTIGRGNDSMVFDPQERRIYTANGFDGTLVIVEQVDANTYKLAEATTTRPYARTMALDPKTKKVYLVTAEGTVDPSQEWNTASSDFYPNVFFRDTFTLLTYSRR
jgi:DNA-binding beta-propeller fold protein YncE